MTAIYQELNYTCRCCARCETEDTKNTLKLQSIYERPPESISLMSIAEIFAETTSRVVITQTIGMPQVICASCVRKVLQIQTFLDMCLESEHKLRNRILNKKENPNITNFQQGYKSLDNTSLLNNVSKIKVELSSNEDDQILYECQSLSNVDSMLRNFKQEIDVETNETSSNSTLHNLEIVKHNTNEKPFQCEHCGLVVASNYSLNRHIKMHSINDNEKMYNCKFCPRDFRIAAELRKHILEHKNESSETRKRHLAERQKKDAVLQPNLSIMPKTVAVNSFKLNTCAHANTTTTLVKKEENDPLDINQANDSEAFDETITETDCEAINKEYKNRNFETSNIKETLCTDGNVDDEIEIFAPAFNKNDVLDTNEAVDHTNSSPKFNRKFLCECLKTFESFPGLYKHLQKLKHRRRFNCVKCTKYFFDYQQFKLHKSIHSKLTKCIYCKVRFSSEYFLLHHKCKQKGMLPYKCKYCNCVFEKNANLIEHFREHLGDKVHQCSLCPRGFQSHSAMQEHFEEHKDDDAATQKRNFDERITFDAKIKYENCPKYSYACKHCGKHFLKLNVLLAHMHTHNAQKSHECAFCNFSTITRGSLKKHLGKHFGHNNMYRCKLCPCGFLFNSDLKKHSLVHLNENEETRAKNLAARQKKDYELLHKLNAAKP